MSGFIEVPFPPYVVITETERYSFFCSHSLTERIIWIVNEGVLGVETFLLDIITSSIQLHGGSRVYILEMIGHFEHNETIIECKADFGNGSAPLITPRASFLIQGV